MRVFIQIVIIVFLFFQIKGQSTTKLPTLKYSNIQELNIALPYIKYYGKDSTLLVFGSNHTNDHKNPQIKQIYNIISSYKPTVVLYEGDGIAIGKTQKETVETYFEMGLVKYLSDSIKIPAVNIEPRTQDKYTILLTKYETEDIMLATLGLQITMLQLNHENFETHYPTMIRDLIKEGLMLTKKQQTLSYFYALYKKKFGRPFSYENFDSRDFQAKYNRTIFNSINQMANEFRDQHIVNLTKQYLEKNSRIFLIEGGWHAIVCEPAYELITE